MNENAELKARRWLAEQLAWERRLEELREAAGIAGADITTGAVTATVAARNAA